MTQLHRNDDDAADLIDAIHSTAAEDYVPLSVRSRSRVVSWLWRRTAISYERARWLARWLP